MNCKTILTSAVAALSLVTVVNAGDPARVTEGGAVVVRFVREVETFNKSVLPKSKKAESAAALASTGLVSKPEGRKLIVATGIRNGRFVVEPEPSAVQVASAPAK
jgi:hypothetical protein